MIDRNHIPYDFGSGAPIGRLYADGQPEYLMTPDDKARLQGWLIGCPVVESLIEQRGADVMAGRYEQINQAFYLICDIVGRKNPELAGKLLIGVDRNEHEPVGEFEPSSVPANYEHTMAPMGTLVGYGLPRLFLKEASSGSDETHPILGGSENEYRKWVAEHLIEEISDYETPERFMAAFAKAIFQSGHVDYTNILSSTLPKGWYQQHRADGQVTKLKRELETHAPVLWGKYRQLTQDKKDRLGII